MALSEYEKQKLEIARQQVEAMNANTRALQALREPPPEPTAEERAKRQSDFLSYRKGGRPKHVEQRWAMISLYFEKEDVGEARTGFQVVFDEKSPKGRLFDVFDAGAAYEIGLPLAKTAWLKLHPEAKAEFDLYPDLSVCPNTKLRTGVGQILYKKFTNPNLFELIGQDVNRCGKNVRWLDGETAPAPVATDTVAPLPMPPTEDGEPVHFDVPSSGSKRLESLVAK
jgi:hypothetical protein